MYFINSLFELEFLVVIDFLTDFTFEAVSHLMCTAIDIFNK